MKTGTTGSKAALAAAAVFAAVALAGCETTKSSADSSGGTQKMASAKGKCIGVNSCKGTSSCKTASSSCKGQNSCKGTGFVALTKSVCDQVGGKFET